MSCLSTFFHGSPSRRRVTPKSAWHEPSPSRLRGILSNKKDPIANTTQNHQSPPRSTTPNPQRDGLSGDEKNPSEPAVVLQQKSRNHNKKWIESQVEVPPGGAPSSNKRNWVPVVRGRGVRSAAPKRSGQTIAPGDLKKRVSELKREADGRVKTTSRPSSPNDAYVAIPSEERTVVRSKLGLAGTGGEAGDTQSSRQWVRKLRTSVPGTPGSPSSQRSVSASSQRSKKKSPPARGANIKVRAVGTEDNTARPIRSAPRPKSPTDAKAGKHARGARTGTSRVPQVEPVSQPLEQTIPDQKDKANSKVRRKPTTDQIRRAPTTDQIRRAESLQSKKLEMQAAAEKDNPRLAGKRSMSNPHAMLLGPIFDKSASVDSSLAALFDAVGSVDSSSAAGDSRGNAADSSNPVNGNQLEAAALGDAGDESTHSRESKPCDALSAEGVPDEQNDCASEENESENLMASIANLSQEEIRALTKCSRLGKLAVGKHILSVVGAWKRKKRRSVGNVPSKPSFSDEEDRRESVLDKIFDDMLNQEHDSDETIASEEVVVSTMTSGATGVAEYWQDVTAATATGISALPLESCSRRGVDPSTGVDVDEPPEVAHAKLDKANQATLVQEKSLLRQSTRKPIFSDDAREVAMAACPSLGSAPGCDSSASNFAEQQVIENTEQTQQNDDTEQSNHPIPPIPENIEQTQQKDKPDDADCVKGDAADAGCVGDLVADDADCIGNVAAEVPCEEDGSESDHLAMCEANSGGIFAGLDDDYIDPDMELYWTMMSPTSLAKQNTPEIEKWSSADSVKSVVSESSQEEGAEYWQDLTANGARSCMQQRLSLSNCSRTGVNELTGLDVDEGPELAQARAAAELIVGDLVQSIMSRLQDVPSEIST